MESPTDDDDFNTDEVVVGKTRDSGLKVTYVTFDYSELLDLQNKTHNVWVYESNIFLRLKSTSEGSDEFVPLVTQIRPLLEPHTELETDDLQSNDLIGDVTGEFKVINKTPKKEKLVTAPFTETIHTFVNPSGIYSNKENHGIILTHENEDGEDVRTDAKDVRFYGFDEINEDYMPKIDVCYKIVEVKKCQEGEEEILVVIENSVTIDAGKPNKNNDNENLVAGSTDGDTTAKRFLIKFNPETFDTEKYDITKTTDAWIHLTIDTFSDGTPVDNTYIVKTVTEDWNEETTTWNTGSTISDDGEEVSTFEIPSNQPGRTPIEVTITGQDIEKLLFEDKGFMIINSDEDQSGVKLPEFFSKDTGDNTKPTLHVCVPSVTPTTTPTQTVTPTYTTASPTTSEPPLLTNCTIPDGGDRVVIDISKFIEIQKNPTSNTNENYMQIGETKENGEKVMLLYFDLMKAVEDAGIDPNQITVTDSRINFRLSAAEDGNDEPWVPGRPTLYPLKHKFNPDEKDYDWENPWEDGDGPQPTTDYHGTVSSPFKKLNKKPDVSKWLQGVTTNIMRYYFTDVEEVKKNINGFVLRYITEDNTPASHFVSFDSPDFTDDEFRPFMDICFLPVEYPITCEEGELKIYDLDADTYLAPDYANHGSEQWLLVGNSGWSGKARSLIDFDISTFNTDLTELFDEDQSVYLRLWYDGPVMGKPYNDPQMINRNVVAHKVRKHWHENSATNKLAYNTKSAKSTWGTEMMQEDDDYYSDIIDSVSFKENQGKHFAYWNLTSVFKEWTEDKSSDNGVVLKDNLHETVPGMYLKFSSMDSDQAKPDESHPSLKPKLMVCQKPAKCEAVDDEPQIYFDAHGCESSNVTLNRCVAKNGACSSEMHDQEDRDNGFYTGVSALWDSHHVLKTFCKCCVEHEKSTIKVPMDCSGAPDNKPDYEAEFVRIETCECQACQEVSSTRKKRATPSKTRLLLRSALKSILKT